MPEQAIDLLPELLRDMAQTCGLEAVLALVDWRGGRYIHVPRRLPESDHVLVRTIGRDALSWLMFDALGGGFCGERILIPNASGYLRAARNDRIRSRNAHGWSVAALSEHTGLHVRQIWRILSADDAANTAAERQSELF